MLAAGQFEKTDPLAVSASSVPARRDACLQADVHRVSRSPRRAPVLRVLGGLAMNPMMKLHHYRYAWKSPLIQRTLIAALSAVLLAAPAAGQEKVAEGEYRLRRSASEGRSTAFDHWILYTRKQGGYRLESEVTAARDKGVIVIQTEELTEQMNPTAIAIKLYTRENTRKPFSQLSCRLTAEQIECQAGGQPLGIHAETAQKGPVLLAITDLEGIDMPWMVAGAISRAHLEEGTVQVPTLLLQDGEDGPELAQKEIDRLQIGDKETVEVRGANIPARRYSLENHTIKCWVANSGLLLKMQNEDGSVIELEKFKQYKKLIPELP
jgi:hypothetical protein